LRRRLNKNDFRVEKLTQKKSFYQLLSALFANQSFLAPMLKEKFPKLAPPAEHRLEFCPIAPNFGGRRKFPNVGVARLAQNFTEQTTERKSFR
jgi:hypothetical protein